MFTDFVEQVTALGPLGSSEGLDPEALKPKLRAAVSALEGRTFRMLFAKQARKIKDEGSYGEFPDGEKLVETFYKEMALNETLSYLGEKERSAPELAGLLGVDEDSTLA
ncbi:hypothetical protein LCGC14_2673130, partial [marine sediment metagenome]